MSIVWLSVSGLSSSTSAWTLVWAQPCRNGDAKAWQVTFSKTKRPSLNPEDQPRTAWHDALAQALFPWQPPNPALRSKCSDARLECSFSAMETQQARHALSLSPSEGRKLGFSIYTLCRWFPYTVHLRVAGVTNSFLFAVIPQTGDRGIAASRGPVCPCPVNFGLRRECARCDSVQWEFPGKRSINGENWRAT